MPQLTFIHPDGRRTTLDAASGSSVMRAAVGHDLDGIAADCGGCLSCATCHVYVDEAWAAHLPPPASDEVDMLEMTAAERRPTSRLSCQLIVDTSLDGLVLHLPDSQY